MRGLFRTDGKRLVAMGLGPAVTVLGVDAAVEHLAGRAGLVVPGQYIPVLFAPVACVALVLAARWAGERWMRGLVRAVGVAGVLVGALGTAFHARALTVLLEGAHGWAGFEAALAVAPPLFAPGAFAAVGAVLLALTHPRVRLTVERSGSKDAAAPAAGANPLAA